MVKDHQEYLRTDYEPTRGMRPWYWTVTIALAVLSLIAVSIDLPLAQASNLDQSPGDLRRILKLSELFAHGFGISIIAIALWMMAPRLRRFIPRVVTCAVLPGLTVYLVKFTIPRQRPAYFYPEYPETISETWIGFASISELNSDYLLQSFPSGHTALAFGMAMGLTWILPRGRMLFFSLACMAAYQRIAFSAHWCSDVFAGAALGVMMGGALTQDWLAGKLFGILEKRLAPTSNIEIFKADSERDEHRQNRAA